MNLLQPQQRDGEGGGRGPRTRAPEAGGWGWSVSRDGMGRKRVPRSSGYTWAASRFLSTIQHHTGSSILSPEKVVWEPSGEVFRPAERKSMMIMVMLMMKMSIPGVMAVIAAVGMMGMMVIALMGGRDCYGVLFLHSFRSAIGGKKLSLPKQPLKQPKIQPPLASLDPKTPASYAL